ncbi:hypothetical protein [uncultured Ruminococcus sp.]|uniref:hypothetical protein n=1 Tax=uncultured Ruminococcus sp. TaxID=165186 RepID=UPI0025D7A5A7|nr:hypothetical protein [uncultured Ruminococcus sp.]
MLKKIMAMACALCLTTAVFASCGDTSEGGSSEAATTTTKAAESAAEEASSEEAAAAESKAEEEAPAEESKAEEGGNSAASDLPYIDEVTGLECFKPDPDYKPVTEFKGYDAFLMFADSEWFWSNFSGQGYPEDLRADGAYGVDADVTGDGTYTVSITKDSIAAQDAVLGSYNPQVLLDENEGVVFPANGATVFCVDITGICDGTMTDTGEETKKGDQKKFTDEENYGVNKKARGKYTGQEISVTVDSIKADGKDVEFDDAKIVKGNIESDNNCYRLEIYNEYGKGKEDPAIDKSKLMFSQSLEVTFTITGLDKEDGAAEGDAAEATEEAAETAAE